MPTSGCVAVFVLSPSCVVGTLQLEPLTRSPSSI